MTIPDFWEKCHLLKLNLIPTEKSVAEELARRDKFFIVCILATLGLDLSHVRDQLLSSPTIHTLNEVYSQLLHVSSVPMTIGINSVESFVLVSNLSNVAKGE